ncbi:MAG: HlyD family efflux transporter periplasmic adaptor subunit [Bacteroidota bacterium]|nr:HlyD family efflux transporter periplasmic adaptor subunit [Bacteroidota bacterium]
MEQKKENKPNQELRSTEVQEILGQIPSWIVRWGIGLIFLIIAAFMVGSFFFRYPELIKAPIVITTENPPSFVLAKSNGKITELYVEDKQLVKPGQKLLMIENPANSNDIFEVKSKLSDFQNFLQDFDTLHYILPYKNYQLGDVQPFFSTFLRNYKAYISFLSIDYYSRKINLAKEELTKYKIYYNRLYIQRNLLEEELKIIMEQTGREEKLFKENVIPPSEFEKSQSVLLQKRGEFEQARINLSSLDIDISNLEQEILEYELSYLENKRDLEFQLTESFHNLKSQIALWEQSYLLISSGYGQVSFNKYWAIDQNVSIGEKVVSIIPDNPGEIIGMINLSLKRSGKVKTGQKVNIKLDNFPYLEYGMLKGNVKNISLVPSDNYYVVEVNLPDSLITYHNIQLDFGQEMQGLAEIITNERSLFSRIMQPFRYIIDRNFTSE